MANQLAFKPFYRRNLPHIQPPGATFFITFRLHDSLPIELLQRWREEDERRERRLAALSLEEQAQQRYDDQKRAFGRYDAALDQAGYGPTWLSVPAIADLVFDAILKRDPEDYDLIVFTIMPNHVHMVCTPSHVEDDKYISLPRVMHSLKRKTAWDANSLLGRKGPFWQHESYDHFVRDLAELERIVRYVLDNPVRAGLVESWDLWPWTYWKYRS
jgi:REP element-mobilizing transposase RayT